MNMPLRTVARRSRYGARFDMRCDAGFDVLRPFPGAGLSELSGQDRGAVRCRRPRRRLLAGSCPASDRGAQAALRRGGSAGCGLDHRQRYGREVAARRLHAAGNVEHPHHQRVARPQQAVPTDARLRAGGGHQLFRPRDGGASVGAGEGSQGIHRLCEVEARATQLRLVRRRHALPHGRRAVQSDERHQHRARARTRRPAKCAAASSAATCRWCSTPSPPWRRP